MRRAVATAAVLLAAGLGWASGACQLKGTCEYVDDPKSPSYSISQYCDGSNSATPCEAQISADGTTWISHPLERGVAYGAQRDWWMHLRDKNGRALRVGDVYEVIPYISATPPGGETQWVIAPGNLAEIRVAGNGGDPIVKVHNDSCAEYFLRVVVHVTPNAGAVDSGADSGADAGAPLDAGDDGG